MVPRTLHEWGEKAEVKSGKRAGFPTEVADTAEALEREVCELRQANEILRKAAKQKTAWGSVRTRTAFPVRPQAWP